MMMRVKEVIIRMTAGSTDSKVIRTRTCSDSDSGWRAPGAALPLNASAANCTADGPAGAAHPAACAWARAGGQRAKQTALVIPAQAGPHERARKHGVRGTG